nr:hypothetical protein Iba_chr11aCG1920 [Ipomoea batatas]
MSNFEPFLIPNQIIITYDSTNHTSQKSLSSNLCGPRMPRITFGGNNAYPRFQIRARRITDFIRTLLLLLITE